MADIELLTEEKVVGMAAAACGFAAESRQSYGWRTKNIEEHPLDDALIAKLECYGFTFEPGKASPYDKMKYLDGHSNQKGAEVFESDALVFKLTEKNPYITISFDLSTDEEKRGVVAIPHLWGNCDGGMCHQPTIDKLVKVIAAHFDDSNYLLKKMIDRKDYPVIGWSEIGLGGLRSTQTIFREMYGQNTFVSDLAQSSLSPFNPSVKYEWGLGKLFVRESAQVDLMDGWKKQLLDFKNKLS